jgi:hypothetical protein
MPPSKSSFFYSELFSDSAGFMSGLVSCKYCDQPVAHNAETCPHCGGKAPAVKTSPKRKEPDGTRHQLTSFPFPQNYSEHEPKGPLEKLVAWFFDTAADVVSTGSGFIGCALPVIVFVGYAAIKLIQYLWEVFF